MIAAVCGLASGIAGYFVGGAIFTTTWRMVSGKKFRELEKVCTRKNVIRRYILCCLFR